MKVSTKEFGNRIKTLAHGSEMFRVFDRIAAAHEKNLCGCGWSSGGCGVLAHAINSYIGKRPGPDSLSMFVNLGTKHYPADRTRPPTAQHILATHGKYVLDAHGARLPQSAIRHWQRVEGPRVQLQSYTQAAAKRGGVSNPTPVYRTIRRYMQKRLGKLTVKECVDDLLIEGTYGWIDPHGREYSTGSHEDWIVQNQHVIPDEHKSPHLHKYRGSSLHSVNQWSHDLDGEVQDTKLKMLRNGWIRKSGRDVYEIGKNEHVKHVIDHVLIHHPDVKHVHIERKTDLGSYKDLSQDI